MDLGAGGSHTIFTEMVAKGWAAVQDAIDKQPVTYEVDESQKDAVRKRIAEIFDIPEGVLDLTDEQLHRLLHPYLYDSPLTPDE